jgi:hypothetical protein
MRILITAFLLLGLASCERELFYTYRDYQPKLVVNGLINNQDKIGLTVSTAVPFGSSNNPEYLSNAKVSFFIDGVRQPDLPFDAVNNRYGYDFPAMPGREYRVVVSAPGYPSVEGTAKLPSAGSFGRSTFQDSVSTDSFGFPEGAITVRINDNGAEKNWYRIKILYFNTTQALFDLLPVESEDPLVNQLASQSDGSYVFNDATFNGRNREIRFKTPFGYAQGTPRFMIEMENLSEDFYLYSTSLNRYENTGAALFREPVFVYSNIRDGLGIFAGASLFRDTIR